MLDRKRITIIAAAFGLITIVIFIIYIITQASAPPRQFIVEIDGLADCAQDIRDETLYSAFGSMYNSVVAANERNDEASEEFYSGAVRNGTCRRERINGVMQEFWSVTAIVDIPDAGQSWDISFGYIERRVREIREPIGPFQASCLPLNQLIFGDFNCFVPIQGEVDTTQIDPIFEYLPYSTFSWQVFSPGIRQLGVRIFLSSADTRGTTREKAAERYKQEVREWVNSKGFNFDEYTVNWIID